MFKIIGRKAYNKMMGDVENRLATISDLEEKLQKFTEVHDNETSVKIILDDTLEKATPIIKYNANITDKLIEGGHLSHNDADKFAVQIALLTITEEVVGQLVSSFTAEPAEID